MSWKSSLIKTLALTVAPAKLVSKGVKNIKQDIREEVQEYADRLRIMIFIGLIAFMVVLFASLSLVHIINYYAESIILGYSAVAGIYILILGISAYIYRDELLPKESSQKI